MIQTANWIAPGLCGCVLRITADFPNAINADGTTYRHPTPYTVSDIQIVTMCAGHTAQSQTMMDTSVFFDTPVVEDYQAFLAQKYSITPTPKQNRGYLKYPIANPTPAQMLYSFLSMHAGQIERPTPCGCQAYAFSDETNYSEVMKSNTPGAVRNKQYINHPHHTKHCHSHAGDTPDLANAISDYASYSAQVAAAPTTTG